MLSKTFGSIVPAMPLDASTAMRSLRSPEITRGSMNDSRCSRYALHRSRVSSSPPFDSVFSLSTNAARR